MGTQIKVIALFIILNIISHSATAVIAYPYPVEIVQPDGTKITLILKGDEHIKWAQTVDGYSVLRNSKGFFEYAQLNFNNDLVPSGIQVRNQSQRSSSDIQFLNKTTKGLNYSKKQVGLLKSISTIYEKSSMKAFPATGSRKLVCILMGFADKPFTKTNAEIENLFNQVGYAVDGATGSVYDFYKENSFGQLNLSVTVAGPYTASNNMAYYGANIGEEDADPQALITEAVNLANPSVDYAEFDNDNDGSVDGVYVIYAGYGEEAGASDDAIWAHAWSIPSVTCDGKIVSSYSCSSELKGNTGTSLTRIGVICHEFGHVMGASDFYDTNYGTDGSYNGTGEWDLMASGSWNNNGTTPAHHNSYTKIYDYGWASATTLTSGTITDITLNNAEQYSNSFYRVNTTTAGEYFLIENRQLHKFDSYIPGHGMIIYHVDGNYISTAGNEINAGSHQGMYPVCANATGNPPTTYGIINNGGLPFPGSGNKTSFTDATTPASHSWAGAASNNPITFISENSTDKTISFKYNAVPAAPVAVTHTATEILTTTAILNASVNANNASATVTFEYGYTMGYGTTINGVPNTVAGSEFTDITASLTGLIPNATYNYRVKAVNSEGTTYGENLTFTPVLLNLPVTEDFAATALPAGWTTQNTGTGITERWSLSNSVIAGGDEYELKCTYHSTNPGTTRIITPAINTAGISAITLSFKHMFDDYAPGATILIQSSKDKITWTNEIWSVSSGYGDSGPETITTTLTGNLNSTSTYIAFVVTGDLYQFDYWYIDNISLTIETEITLPVVTTITVTPLTSTTATGEGNITYDGGAAITARGICWSTIANPTIELSTKTTDGTGAGSFVSNITGLTPGTTYHVRAYATNSAGTGYGEDLQFIAPFVIPPTLTTFTVTALTLTTATSGGIISSDGGDAVTMRGVCWNTAANPTTALSTKTTNGTGTGLFLSSITGLTKGTTYHLRAYATNGAGTGYGADIQFTTFALASVTAKQATDILQTGFQATWSSSATATGYLLDISTDETFVSMVAGYSNKDIGNLINTVIAGLYKNTVYYYRVRAYNTEGISANSNTISVTTLQNPPSYPVTSSASDITHNGFTANWNSSADATGYLLDVSSDVTFATFIPGYDSKDVGNHTSADVEGLIANTTYFYRVKAYNTGGISTNSGTTAAKTLPLPPPAPIAISATAVLQIIFTARWNVSETATGYMLDVASDNEFTDFIPGFHNKDIGNLTSIGITGLNPNAPYFYRVRAYNTGGNSANSNTIITTTLPDPPSAPIVNPATGISQTLFTAYWNASVNSTGYRLDISTNSGFTSFVTGFNDKDVGAVTSLIITGLTAKSQYYFRIRAYNTGGTGDYSNILTVTTLTNPPLAPAGLTASSCNNMVTLRWRKGTGNDILRYRIYGGDTNISAVLIDSTTSSASDTTKVISGLTIGQTYYFQVTAVNNDGPASIFSNLSSTSIKTGVVPKIAVKWDDVLICYNLGDSITNYQWYKEISVIPGATKQYYDSKKEAGDYRVEITDINGCKNVSGFKTVSGTKSISTYPNPARNNFSLKFNELSEGRVIVSLINTSGLKVMEFRTESIFDELLKEIPVSNLDDGIYVVRVLINNQDLYFTKIIVLK